MAEGTEFDLDRSIGEAWSQFTDRLAEVVSVIQEGSLTIGTLSTSDEAAPFVRFWHDPARGTGVTLEASGNPELGERSQLTAEQLTQLKELGYQPPSVEEGHPGGRFWTTAEQDDARRLADLAVATLRDVFGVQHPVFLAPDQLAEVLQAEAAPVREAPDYDADDLVAVVPHDRGQLDDLVTAELTSMFGHPPIRDSEGDVAIRVGSSMVFIRSMPEGDELLLFSPLVHEVEGRSRAVEVLNDLNTDSRHGRFALLRDRVFVSLSLFTHPFVPAHLHQALRMISQIADGIDDDLALKLRGRTTFTD